VVRCTVCEAKASQRTLSTLAFGFWWNDYPTCLSLDAVTERWVVHIVIRFAWRKACSRPVVYGQRLEYLCVASAAKKSCLGHSVMGGWRHLPPASVSLIYLGLCVDRTSTVDGEM
jgi:hypothetical protein